MGGSQLVVWIGSLATTAAVVVALFKEEIRSIWKRPKLVVRIRLTAPDCHKTEMRITERNSGRLIAKGDCYYFRIWVENKGHLRAEQVQVFVAKALRRRADNTFEEIKAFLPMNLRWTHSPYGSERPEIFAEGISPRMGKHCDLGHIVHPTLRERIGQTPNGLPIENNILELDLEVLPATKSHLIPPGVYRFELLIGAANSAPVKKTIEINLTPNWYDQEEKMFSDGIGIIEVR